MQTRWPIHLAHLAARYHLASKGTCCVRTSLARGLMSRTLQRMFVGAYWRKLGLKCEATTFILF